MKNLIEISSKNAKAGRTPAKFVLHRIYNNATEYNANGISWSRTYTETNMESVKGMPLVCQFADSDNQIPFGGHGDMTTKDGEVVFEDSLVVGSFENSYIDDNIEINGEKISALVGECYIYNQRFPSLVDYLEEQYNNKEPVESSVEICGDKSKGNSKIIYVDGWKEKGRIPKDYQYSGHALCIGVEPADNSALMIELNSLRLKNSDSKELHNSFDDKEHKNNKEVKQEMDDNKVILELNQKIENKTTEINQLTASNTELTSKNAELSEAVVNANKSLEEANVQVNSLTEELNACKKELNDTKAEKEAAKEEAEKNQKVAETKDYFENEIPKNHFAEDEVNSLKSYVEAGDLVGLKAAESEICTKKFKEMKQNEEKDLDVEVNSTSKSFITFHEKEKKNITNNSDVKFFD